VAAVILPMILALDPGTHQTGYCNFHNGIGETGVMANDDMLEYVKRDGSNLLAIEMIASYGMPVGREVFETCVWIGRFAQAWRQPERVMLAYRKDVKMHLCGTNRAKDANVWQALKDRFGEPGTKAKPGALYGVASHARAALAVAVYVNDKILGDLQ
jgi:hypothetical protein